MTASVQVHEVCLATDEPQECFICRQRVPLRPMIRKLQMHRDQASETGWRLQATQQNRHLACAQNINGAQSRRPSVVRLVSQGDQIASVQCRDGMLLEVISKDRLAFIVVKEAGSSVQRMLVVPSPS